jgi:GNAT superfamily N-acetyltransferase
MTPPSEIDAQHLGILWMLELDRPLPIGPEPRILVTFSRVDPEVAGELAFAMGFDNPAPVLQRFSMGRHCHIARVEGKIAAYGWITFDEEGIGELGLIIRLKKDEAYIWDCATLPAYRGQRLYPALLIHMLGELQNAGLQRVWIGTDADNLPSQSGVALVAFQPVVDIMLTGDTFTRMLSSRAYPGVSTQDVLDAQYALFGNRNATHIALTD